MGPLEGSLTCGQGSAAGDLGHDAGMVSVHALALERVEKRDNVGPPWWSGDANRLSM